MPSGAAGASLRWERGAAAAVDCKERTHIAERSQDLGHHSEADTWRCYKCIAEPQPSRTSAAAHINCLCSVVSINTRARESPLQSVLKHAQQAAGCVGPRRCA